MSVALRILISATLLALVCFQVDWRSVSSAIGKAQWEWLAFAFLSFNASIALASKRWQLIVNADARNRTLIGTRAAIVATYISQWLSNFLPTAFGGDVARVLTARRAGAILPHALASAVLDRFLGFMTMAVIFFLVEATLAGSGESRPLLPVAGLLALAFAASFAMAWGGARIRFRRRWLRSGAVRFVARSTGVLRMLGVKPRVIAPILVASVVGTMLGVLAYWGAIRCVHAGIGFPVALAAGVLGTLASALPVSLSGWGVREGTVAFVLTQAGAMSATDASLVAILNATVIAATSLVGFVVSMSVRWRWQSEDQRSGGSEPTELRPRRET